jgi:hypothetical protein
MVCRITINHSKQVHSLIKAWASYVAARCANVRRSQDVDGIVANVILANSGFHARKNPFENHLQFEHILSKSYSPLS